LFLDREFLCLDPVTPKDEEYIAQAIKNIIKIVLERKKEDEIRYMESKKQFEILEAKRLDMANNTPRKMGLNS